MTKHIWITSQDRQRLMHCIEALREFPDTRDLPHIMELEREINQAEVICDPREVPRDAITMRSRVRLRDSNADEALECTLVYPSESDAEEARVSILAPLGTGMLGYRVGDVFEVTRPKGMARYKVEAVLYQPEASGDFHL